MRVVGEMLLYVLDYIDLNMLVLRCSGEYEELTASLFAYESAVAH
jgi:hypothetical protein